MHEHQGQTEQSSKLGEKRNGNLRYPKEYQQVVLQ